MRIAREVALYNQGGIQNGIDGAEDRASKVATSFITRVSESEGIKVHNADDLTDYIQINSNGVDLVNDNVSIANFGESARVGKNGASRFMINADSLEAYDDNNAKYFEVSADGITFGSDAVASTDYADGKASAAQSAAQSAAAADATAKANEAKKTATNYMYFNSSTGLNIASADPQTATRKVNISADGIKMQENANNYATVSSSGLNVVQSNASVAQFGSSARIGNANDFNLNISSGGFSFKEGSAERVSINAETDSSTVMASMVSSGNASTGALVYANDLSGTEHNAYAKLEAGGIGSAYLTTAPVASVRLIRDSLSATAYLEADYDSNKSAYIRASAGSSSQSIAISGDTNIEGNLTVYGEPVMLRKVSKSSVSSLPTTISSSAITEHMECIHSVLSNPSAQTGDWTVSTSNGSLTISGSISGTTNITLYLAVAST